MKLRFRLAFNAKMGDRHSQRAYDDHFDFPDIGLNKPIYNSEFTGILTPIAFANDEITFRLEYKSQTKEGVLRKDAPLNFAAEEKGDSVFYQISYEA